MSTLEDIERRIRTQELRSALLEAWRGRDTFYVIAGALNSLDAEVRGEVISLVMEASDVIKTKDAS